MPGQLKRTERVRIYLDKFLPTINPGANFYTDQIVTAVTTNRRNLMAREVGMILRERVDVEKVDDGIWRRK